MTGDKVLLVLARKVMLVSPEDEIAKSLFERPSPPVKHSAGMAKPLMNGTLTISRFP